MREVCAIQAEWTYDGELVKLMLAPEAPKRIVSDEPPKKDSPAKRLMRMHETMFAATRMKPPFRGETGSADVPRAVSAERAAARRGTKKVHQRVSR